MVEEKKYIGRKENGKITKLVSNHGGEKEREGEGKDREIKWWLW
jgi:hypothetical protein